MTTEIQTESEKQAANAKSTLATTDPVDEKQLVNGKDQEDAVIEEEVIDGETEEAESEKEETEEELEAKKDELQKPKKKGGFQKRIDKLNGRISAIEQEREYWRTEALRTKETPKTAIETAPIQDASEPKEEDFETAKAFYRAHSLWTVRQELATERKKEKENSIKSEFQSKANQHAERVKALSSKTDDWDEVIDTFKTVKISAAVEQLVLDSGELSAQLVYELGKNPEELERICQLPYGEAARTIGKLEARLEKPKTPVKEKETITKAPKPVVPVRAKGAVVPKGYRDNMSLKEYEAWRKSERAAKA